METKLSKLLTEFPSFLSAVSMVADDREQIIRELQHAERPSPEVYRPARELFLSVLRGHLDFESALAQAGRVPDEVARRCARDVLRASKSFLMQQQPTEVIPLRGMGIELPNGMELRVSPVWHRRFSPARVLVLHFWRDALSDWQLRAAAGILRLAPAGDKPACLGLDLDFVSVAVPDHSAARRLRSYTWQTLDPLRGDELDHFLQRLCDAWAKYQERGPRPYKARPRRDLFNLASELE